MGGRGEPEPRVERECGGVGLLGVDPAGRHAATAQPVQGVGDQVDAEAFALAIGVHRESLEVALGTGTTGDRVADHVGITHDPQP